MQTAYDKRAEQAARNAYQAWLDGTDGDGPGLRALVKAWAKYHNVDPRAVWDAIDPYLD